MLTPAIPQKPTLVPGHMIPMDAIVYLENGGGFRVAIDLDEIARMCRRAAKSKGRKCRVGAITVRCPR